MHVGLLYSGVYPRGPAKVRPHIIPQVSDVIPRRARALDPCLLMTGCNVSDICTQ